jgi:hypothetical protein
MSARGKSSTHSYTYTHTTVVYFIFQLCAIVSSDGTSSTYILLFFLVLRIVLHDNGASLSFSSKSQCCSHPTNTTLAVYMNMYKLWRALRRRPGASLAVINIIIRAALLVGCCSDVIINEKPTAPLWGDSIAVCCDKRTHCGAAANTFSMCRNIMTLQTTTSSGCAHTKGVSPSLSLRASATSESCKSILAPQVLSKMHPPSANWARTARGFCFKPTKVVCARPWWRPRKLCCNEMWAHA